MVCLFKLDPLERALYLTLCYRCSIARIKERLEHCEGAWQYYSHRKRRVSCHSTEMIMIAFKMLFFSESLGTGYYFHLMVMCFK